MGSRVLILKQAENRQKLVVFSFQSDSKAAENGKFLLAEAVMKR